MSLSSVLLTVDIAISSLIILSVLVSNARRNVGPVLFAGLIVIFVYLHFLSYVYISDNDALQAELFGTFRPLGFLIGPLLYFYILSVTRPSFGLKWVHSLHLIPAFLALLTTLPIYFLSFSEKLSLIHHHANLAEVRVRFALFMAFGVAYLLLSYREVQKFEVVLKSQFSCLSKWKLNWLKVCLMATILVWSACLAFVAYGLNPQVQKYISLLMCATTYLLAFTAIRRSILFEKGEERTDLKTIADPMDLSALPIDEVLKKMGWPKQDFDRKLEKITKIMEKEKLYRNTRLRLRDLASAAEIPEYQVSQLVNIGHKKNFFDFVNSYRIKEAKKILSETSKKNFNIIEVAYEVGFNSKSTFNNAFKKNVGKTPTEFRSNP